jgi:hypothetical protein
MELTMAVVTHNTRAVAANVDHSAEQVRRFQAVGDAIDDQWRRRNYDERCFPEIAQRALEELRASSCSSSHRRPRTLWDFRLAQSQRREIRLKPTDTDRFDSRRLRPDFFFNQRACDWRSETTVASARFPQAIARSSRGRLAVLSRET